MNAPHTNQGYRPLAELFRNGKAHMDAPHG